MSKLRSAGLFQKKKAARYLIGFILVCLFAVFVIRLNQVEKTELVVRTGQTFEKAEVVKILQDNLEDNGTRVGEQKVRVRMLTGVRKGEELDITSSSGYLFGARLQSGNESDRYAKCCRRFNGGKRIFPGQGMGDLYFCRFISSCSLHYRRMAGDQRMSWDWSLPFFA